MNNKFLLLVALSVAPVAIKAADVPVFGPDFSTKAWKNHVAHGQRNARADIAAAEAVRSRNSQGILDARFYPESTDDLFNPIKQPSWFNTFGKQVAFGVTLTLASIVATILAKKYLTPQTEKDREAVQTTANEQTVIRNLKAEIEQLEINMMPQIPALKKQLSIETNPERIERLNAMINGAEELMQRKLALLSVLSQKFEADQAHRFGLPQATGA